MEKLENSSLPILPGCHRDVSCTIGLCNEASNLHISEYVQYSSDGKTNKNRIYALYERKIISE